MENGKTGRRGTAPNEVGATFPPERRNLEARAALVRTVRSEFREWPQLALTLAQAARLFDLREDICSRVLAGLIRDGLLYQRHDGRFTPRAEAAASVGSLSSAPQGR